MLFSQKKDRGCYSVGIVNKEGKLVPKSDKNTIRIPFDTEYGIVLKNTTGNPCAVEIEIDGTSILGGKKIELSGEKIVIDRFCVDGDLSKGKRLKFVSKEDESVQDPDSKENGNVIVKFIPAKNNWRLQNIDNVFGGRGRSIPIATKGGGRSSSLLSSVGPSNVVARGMHSGGMFVGNVSCCALSESSMSASESLIGTHDIGATVEGAISSQEFSEGIKLDLEENSSSTISFSLRGDSKIEDGSKEGMFICKAGFCLDRSGSMSSKRKEAVEAFNGQLATLKNSPKNVETLVTFGTFSTEADALIFEDKPVGLVPEINQGNYQPDGGTAMLDGVGEIIESMYLSKNSLDKNTSMLVIIVSDGEENSSKVYDWNDISDLVTHLQSTGRWTFVYLGADQNLAEVQKNMGLSLGNVKLFDNNSKGMAEGTKVVSAATGSYLRNVSAGVCSSEDFYNSK